MRSCRCRSRCRSTGRCSAAGWRCAPASSSIGSSPPAATATCRPHSGCRPDTSSRVSSAIERFPGLRRRGLTGAADLVRLRHARSRSADVQLGARSRGARRRAGQPRRGDRPLRKTAGGLPACGGVIDRVTGRAFEMSARVDGQCDVAARSTACWAPSGSTRHSDAQGDEPGHDARRRRRRARRAVGVGPPSVSGAVAASRASSAPGNRPPSARPDDVDARPAEIASFIGELNEAFPALDLKPGRRHAGASRGGAGRGRRRAGVPRRQRADSRPRR